MFLISSQDCSGPEGSVNGRVYGEFGAHCSLLWLIPEPSKVWFPHWSLRSAIFISRLFLHPVRIHQVCARHCVRWWRYRIPALVEPVFGASDISKHVWRWWTLFPEVNQVSQATSDTQTCVRICAHGCRGVGETPPCTELCYHFLGSEGLKLKLTKWRLLSPASSLFAAPTSPSASSAVLGKASL